MIWQTRLQVSLILYFLSIVALLCLSGVAFAQDFPVETTDFTNANEQQQARRQALEKEQADIVQVGEQIRVEKQLLPNKLAALSSEDITDAMVQQARVDADSARLLQEDLQIDLANSKRRIDELTQQIRDLQAQEQLLQNPARKGEDEAQRVEQLQRTREMLQQQQNAITLEKLQLGNLQSRFALLKQRLELAEQWQARLEELYRARQEENRQALQEDVASRLQSERQRYFDRVAKITTQLEREQDTLSEAQRRRLETERETSDELARLLQLDIRMAAIDSELKRLEELSNADSAKLEVLRDGLRQLRDLRDELAVNADLLARKLELFQQQQQVIEQRRSYAGESEKLVAAEVGFVGAVLTELNRSQGELQGQLIRVEALEKSLQAAYFANLGRELFARRTLPETAGEWRDLLASIAGAPQVLVHQVQLSVASIGKSMAEAGPLRWLGFIGLELSLLALMVTARHVLRRTLQNLKPEHHTPFFSEFATILCKLPQINMLGIMFTGALLLVLWMFPIPPPGRGIIITLALLWLGIKIPITLAWLLLAAPHLPPERRRPRLYRHWHMTLWGGGVLAALTVVAHLSGLQPLVLDAFDRVLMLYLLLIIFPVLQARNLLMQLLAGQYGNRYWLMGLRLVSFVVPLGLLGMSVVGLLGYVNLAWISGWILMVSLGLVMAWVIGQGLLNDLVAWIKYRMVRRSKGKRSTARAVVSTAHRILSILLFLGMSTVVINLYVLDETVGVAWRVLVVAVLAVIITYETVYLIAGHISRRNESVLADGLVRNSRKPLGFILPIAAAQLILPTLDLPEYQHLVALGRHALALAQIAAVTWLLIRLVSLFDYISEQRYRVDARDSLGARRVRTQIRVLRQFLHITIFLFGVALMLMTFPAIRQLGTGLLASAGAAGIIIGIAARPLFENLIAGIQIGLTQPIRLGDVVIVEGEWGRIEEISATYVVVHIWDERRLVLPLKYFNEQPFENWTRNSSNLLGTVFIHTDYTFPVEEGRKALKRILEETELWDGRVWVLQVTDAKEHTMELRALMSAPDAPTAWDLRCHVREKFLEFLQREYPEALPKTRAVLAPLEEQEEELITPRVLSQA